MDDPTPRDLDALTAEPAELDGHTIDELAAYLDAGRVPYDPAIEESAACRHALAALERLHAVSADLLSDPPAGEEDDSWVAGVLAHIAADAHAGADFPVAVTAEGDEVVMTEGALRALLRAVGDDEPGVLVGRIRFAGDLADPSSTVVITVDVTLAQGLPIPLATSRLRAAMRSAVERHIGLQPVLDIVVRDLTTEDR